MEWTAGSWIIFLVSAGIGFVFGSFCWWWVAKRNARKVTEIIEQIHRWPDLESAKKLTADRHSDKVREMFERKRRQRGIKADE